MIPAIEQDIPAVTRDRKDDYLLAYAVVGAGGFLVAGDDDLPGLKKVCSLHIVSQPAFAEMLHGRAG